MVLFNCIYSENNMLVMKLALARQRTSKMFQTSFSQQNAIKQSTTFNLMEINKLSDSVRSVNFFSLSLL